MPVVLVDCEAALVSWREPSASPIRYTTCIFIELQGYYLVLLFLLVSL